MIKVNERRLIVIITDHLMPTVTDVFKLFINPQILNLLTKEDVIVSHGIWRTGPRNLVKCAMENCGPDLLSLAGDKRNPTLLNLKTAVGVLDEI